MYICTYIYIYIYDIYTLYIYINIYPVSNIYVHCLFLYVFVYVRI